MPQKIMNNTAEINIPIFFRINSVVNITAPLPLSGMVGIIYLFFIFFRGISDLEARYEFVIKGQLADISRLHVGDKVLFDDVHGTGTYCNILM